MGATAFVVTNMVGTGVFTIPALIKLATGNGTAALGVWVAGAVLALCGALCYAELATRMPEAGGEYRFLARSYGPLFGFLSGWISFLVGFSAAIAAAALGGVGYFEALVPGWNASTPVIGPINQGALLSAILILILAVFHCLGVKSSGRLQSSLMILLLGAIGVLVIMGLASGRGQWSNVTAESAGTGNWWVALIQVSFAYGGWNAAAYLGGEAVDPHRTLPRALIGGTLAVGLIYLALNLMFIYALPLSAWHPDIAVGKLAAELLFGTTGARIVSGIIALTILGSVSAMTVAGPRVYYSMGHDGLAPEIFGHLHATTHAPVVAILAQALIAIALALTGEFGTLLTYVGSALLLFNGLTVATIFRIRKKSTISDPRIFLTPGYPFTPAFFILAVIVSWLFGLRDSPGPTGAALLTVIAGIVLYYAGCRFNWLKPAIPSQENH